MNATLTDAEVDGMIYQEMQRKCGELGLGGKGYASTVASGDILFMSDLCILQFCCALLVTRKHLLYTAH